MLLVSVFLILTFIAAVVIYQVCKKCNCRPFRDKVIVRHDIKREPVVSDSSIDNNEAPDI